MDASPLALFRDCLERVEDYLTYLQYTYTQGTNKISDCFDDPRQKQRWQHRTRWFMTEMAVFLRWIDDWLRARPGMVPVPLFRDTLLIYLGFTWLGQRPIPVFINRAFANTWSDNRPVHDSLVDVVYRVLLEHGACSLATMRRCFAGHIQGHGGAVSAPGGV